MDSGEVEVGIYAVEQRGRMERLEFFSKKVKLAGWLCVALAFFAGGLLEIRHGDGPHQAGGWLCVVLFGVGGLVLIKELLQSGPRLVLSGEGLYDRSLGTPVIPWPSIVEVGTSSLKKSGYITLQLADEAQRVAELTIQKRAMVAWNKKLGGNAFNMGLSTLDKTPQEVLEAIVTYWKQYGSKRAGAA